MLWLLLTGAGLAAQDEAATADAVVAEPSDAEISALIETLEDEQARERLVAQLRLMLSAREDQRDDLGTATAEALHGLSAATTEFFQQLVVVAAGIDAIPGVTEWMRQQAADPGQRRLWLSAFGNVLLIVLAGYAALYLIRLALRRPSRLLAKQPLAGWWARAGLLLLSAVFEVTPIAVFGVVAYLVLGLSDPVQPARLVALAWITAIVAMRIVVLLGRLTFAARSPNLRLLPLSDETAHYGEIWVGRLAAVGVYGYFLIQSAALLGMPVTAADAMTQLLGLLMALLLFVLILQNRNVVASWIRGRGEGQRPLQRLRTRLAAYWHLPASLYLFVLFGIWALSPQDGSAYLLHGTLLTVLALVLGTLLLRVIDHLSQRGLALPTDLKARLPGLESRANRYLPALHGGVRAVVYLLIALAVLQAWGLGGFGWLLHDPGRALAATLGSVVLIAIGALLLWEVASLAIEGYLAQHDAAGNVRARSARSRTLLSVARTAIAVVLSVVSVLLILSEIGIDITPLLATAGVLGLAVGFGSQKLVQDLITGFFILLEDVFSVGDVIRVGDRAGLVEAVSIRNVRLRDLSGTVHTLPFSTIDTISNLTKEFSCYVFELGVAYREDVDQVMDEVRAIGAGMRADQYFGDLIIEDLEVFGLDSFGDSAVVIKGRIKTLPIKQWEVGREFNRRVKQRFDELGIEIPFPHRTLYFGIGKDGTAPPAPIRSVTDDAGDTRRTPDRDTSAANGGQGDDKPRAQSDSR